jgi:hypothetical protein
MKYIFVIVTAIWFIAQEQCRNANLPKCDETAKTAQVVNNKSQPEETVVGNDSIQAVYDSLNTELFCRITCAENGLGKLKKKLYPSEALHLISASDPIYCK